MLEIEKILVLSTQHMPNTTPDFGELRATAHDYGYIVFLSSDEDRATDWLAPIVQLAVKQGCHYINFDRDAGESNTLPTLDRSLVGGLKP